MSLDLMLRMIPEYIKNKVEQILNANLVDVQLQSGGDINQVAILNFDSKDSHFLKWNFNASESMFSAEAKGLELLSEAETSLIIPKVQLIDKGFLLLSLVNSEPKRVNSGFNFGVNLAKLHKQSSSSFGLDHDNFIGKLPQSNSTHNSWTDFFISERVEPQIKLGIDSGKFSSNLIIKTKKLEKKVEKLFPKEEPSLLHGDLWSGNYMFTKNGKASIYDPAVYYGHREMDLAMTRLFGGFSKEFYTGYQSEYPLADGFEERVDICNLYPILVHANLFGGGYIQQASDMLKKLVKNMA